MRFLLPLVQIAWVRVDTGTILTLDEMLISRNQRYGVAKGEGGTEWTFTIKLVHTLCIPIYWS